MGGVERLSELVDTLPTPSVDWLLASLTTPVQIFRMWSHLAPLVLGMLRMDVEERPDGSIRVAMRLPDDAPDARRWFEVCTRPIGGMVTRIGLPRAEMESVRIGAREAEWVIRVPGHAVPSDDTPPLALTYASEVGEAYREALRELDEVRRRIAGQSTALPLAQAGALFIVDAERRLAWTNDAGREWMSTTPQADARLRSAVRGAGDALLHAIPLQQPEGSHLVVLQDAARDFE
ncbi:MAG: hypothetical protein ACK4YP_17615, partial [Myxococcota bacterium]